MQEIQPCIIFDPHNLHLCKYTTHLFVVKSNLFRATAHTHENPFTSTLDLDELFPLLNEAFHKALEADTHFLGLVHGDKLHVDWFYDEGEFFPAMDVPLEGNPCSCQQPALASLSILKRLMILTVWFY